jgi:hypothetical protein
MDAAICSIARGWSAAGVKAESRRKSGTGFSIADRAAVLGGPRDGARIGARGVGDQVRC